MSSAVVSTSAALGRPFAFDGEISAIKKQSKITPASVIPASRLEIRPAPEMVPSGIPAIDALTGGLPRGCLTEICGPASSGRTTMLLAALAAATRRGEFCALIDASDALDPQSAFAAGIELDRLLWVRCGEETQPGCPISRTSFAREVGKASQSAFDFDRTRWKENVIGEKASRQSEHRLEQVLRATDLLLESGGFGLIVLDLADLPPDSARRVPLTTWFRYRRAIEHTPTILLAIEQHPIAGSCSSLLLKLELLKNEALHATQIFRPTHAQLFTGLDISAELISRLDRKPARSVAFATKTAWAG
jgi:RecA DNA recombination protein